MNIEYSSRNLASHFAFMPEKKAEPNNLCLIRSQQNLSTLGQFQINDQILSIRNLKTQFLNFY